MFDKVPKKGSMLFLGVMAACAVSIPTAASAASWTGTLGTHGFDGSNPANRVSLSMPILGAGWTCAVVQFDIDVRSSTDAVITSALSENCMGTGNAVNCTVTETASDFPWTVTDPATPNITWDNLRVTSVFENTPGNPTACAIPSTIAVTGSLAGGSWNNSSHEIVFASATGLTAHTPLGSIPATLTGTVRDTAQTLTMAD